MELAPPLQHSYLVEGVHPVYCVSIDTLKKVAKIPVTRHTHRLCGAKSEPIPDEFTGAKKWSVPTPEIWC